MKSPTSHDGLPSHARENLEGIAKSMLAEDESVDIEHIKEKMRKFLGEWQAAERKSYLAVIDERIRFLRDAEREAERDLHETQDKAGLFNKGGGMQDLEAARKLLQRYPKSRLKIVVMSVLKTVATLLCSIAIVGMELDAMQDSASQSSLLGFLRDHGMFEPIVLRPWLYMLLIFLLGKLVVRICLHMFQEETLSKLGKGALGFSLVFALGIWLWISKSFKQGEDYKYTDGGGAQVPVDVQERNKKL